MKKSFEEWYSAFRAEMVKKHGVNYAICIASDTFKENHRHLFDDGKTPEEGVKRHRK